MMIITNRNLLLSGNHYTAGEPKAASEEDAGLALRNGWATAAPAAVRAKGKSRASKAGPDPETDDGADESPTTSRPCTGTSASA